MPFPYPKSEMSNGTAEFVPIAINNKFYGKLFFKSEVKR